MQTLGLVMGSPVLTLSMQATGSNRQTCSRYSRHTFSCWRVCYTCPLPPRQSPHAACNPQRQSLPCPPHLTALPDRSGICCAIVCRHAAAVCLGSCTSTADTLQAAGLLVPSAQAVCCMQANGTRPALSNGARGQVATGFAGRHLLHRWQPAPAESGEQGC